MTLEEKIAVLPWLAWCKDGHYFFAETAVMNVKCPTCGLEMSGASKMDERTAAEFAECTCDEDDVKHWPGCDVAVTAHLISRARQAEALEGENRRLRDVARFFVHLPYLQSAGPNRLECVYCREGAGKPEHIEHTGYCIYPIAKALTNPASTTEGGSSNG